MNKNLWNYETKFFVIINQYDYDVSWKKQLKFPHVVYTKDTPENEPFNAINKAKSESNILKFIYEFYDNLPENLISIHQYNIRPWQHTGDIVDILNDSNFENRYTNNNIKGYMSLNHFKLGDVNEQIPRMLNSGWWDNTMKPYFGNIHDYGNFTKGKYGCAQYVVSRERIRSLPIEFYKNMYDWLINNSLSYLTTYNSSLSRKGTPIDNNINSDYYTSRYMEWSWQLIFTARLPEYSEKINYKGNQISASYGALKYHIDVIHIIKNFIKSDKLIIEPSVDLNILLSDPIFGTIKKLTLFINNICIIIDEKRTTKVEIEIK